MRPCDLTNSIVFLCCIVYAAINPCLRGVCHANAVCAHTGPNKHVCTCTEGYSGDGHVCMPIDPCQTNLGNCTSRSTRCVYDGPGKVCLCVCKHCNTLCTYLSHLNVQIALIMVCPSSQSCCFPQAHCECLEGFVKFVEGVGCSIKDMCKPDSCHKYAACATVEPGRVE